MRVGLIGFGNMAQALVAAWRLMPEINLYAASPSIQSLTDECVEKIHISSNNLCIAQQCEIIILAVKPQQALAVMQQISPVLLPNSVIVSVVAGLSLQKLSSVCNSTQAIIRSMPNLPVAKQKGATPLLANSFVTNTQHSQVDKLFCAVGMTSWVNSDDLIDKFTALSGSGPAYILYFLEALIAAGLELGLAAEDVHAFTLQTMYGTAALLDDKQVNLTALRHKITSPGGTTAAAIQSLATAEFTKVIADAVTAAYKRAKELAIA